MLTMSSPRVLTMDFVQGVKVCVGGLACGGLVLLYTAHTHSKHTLCTLTSYTHTHTHTQVTDIRALEQLGIAPHRVAQLVSQTFNEMIFTHGDVHCDPHAVGVMLLFFCVLFVGSVMVVCILGDQHTCGCIHTRVHIRQAYASVCVSSTTLPLPHTDISPCPLTLTPSRTTLITHHPHATTLTPQANMLIRRVPSSHQRPHQRPVWWPLSQQAGPLPGQWQLVLLDHGLYRQIDDTIRHHYAGLWMSLIFGDVEVVSVGVCVCVCWCVGVYVCLVVCGCVL